ncbi:MAG: sulfatase [Chloroflexi bacterium]|nr:sulfatase [Chloroflexota bacterium]
MKNVIVIMADSWQFNYAGCYGNEWIQTPNIDRLARESTLFENAYAEGLPTVPCRRAMMTGRYTLPFKGWSPLDKEDTTIADILWGRGIHTALIYDTAPMQMPKYGYSRGFNDVIFRHGHELDHYFYAQDKLTHLQPEDYIEAHTVYNEKGEFRTPLGATVMQELPEYLKLRQHWKSEEDNYVAVLVKEAIHWLERVDRRKPFMLWLDSFDPHEPWDPPSVWDPNLKCPYDPAYNGKDMIIPVLGPVEGVFTEEELHHIRMLYAEKITLVDRWLGKFLDKVRELGLWDDTMIIFCSDHGEPLGNGEHGHGIMRKCRPWPYEELAHIPLIVRVPGVGEGKRVKSFIQSCDVAPTIADYFGIEHGEVRTHGVVKLPSAGIDEMQGHSLLPLIRGEKGKVRDFAIAGYFSLSWSIIRDDYSFIHWVRGYEKTTDLMTHALAHDGGGTQQGQWVKEFEKQDKDMWTCTPGAQVVVPADDELYDRQKDPFQLKNIAREYPDVAREMLRQLREYMSELRVT